MLGLGSDTECNSREEPSTLHVVKVHRKSRTDGDVMSEGPPKCKQSPRIVVDAYLSVGMRSSELMGLQIRPSVRPAGRPAAFPAADRWKCLQLGCVRFTAGWPRPSVTQSNSHLPPTPPPNKPSTPKISRYGAEMDSSSPPVPSSLFPLWQRCFVLTSHHHCSPQVLRAFFRLRFQAMQVATQR